MQSKDMSLQDTDDNIQAEKNVQKNLRLNILHKSVITILNNLNNFHII